MLRLARMTGFRKAKTYQHLKQDINNHQVKNGNRYYNMAPLSTRFRHFESERKRASVKITSKRRRSGTKETSQKRVHHTTFKIKIEHKWGARCYLFPGSGTETEREEERQLHYHNKILTSFTSGEHKKKNLYRFSLEYSYWFPLFMYIFLYSYFFQEKKNSPISSSFSTLCLSFKKIRTPKNPPPHTSRRT